MIFNRNESSEILKLAWPTILGMISSTLMGLVDTAMVGRLSAEALAAVGLANMLVWAISSLVNSVNIGVQTVSARRYGEKKFKECGLALHNGFLLSLFAGTIVSLIVLSNIESIFSLINNDPKVVKLGDSYLYYRIYGVLPGMLSFAIYGFFNGISKTKVHMQVSIISNVVNVILNYALIFGKLGFPEMGVKGAAIGTVISIIIGFLNYVIWLFNPEIREKFGVFKTKIYDTLIMKRIISLSTASGIQGFLVLIGFSVFMIFIGQIGTIELASSEIVFNILSFSFMPGVGFSMAVGTLVGKNMGENNIPKAESLIWETMKLNILFMGSMGLIFIMIPKSILLLFTSDMTVINMGILPLRILGFVQFIDAIGMTLMGALRGAGDTRYIAIIDAGINWAFFVPATYVFGIYLGFGIMGAWMSFIVYIVLFALFMYLRFRSGIWKYIKV